DIEERNKPEELEKKNKPEELEEFGEQLEEFERNKRKEPIEALYQKLKKLKSDLKVELFELALRHESKNQETLNIYNCYKNEEYWEIIKTIKDITLTIEYKDRYYQNPEQIEKGKQEWLQNSYRRFLEELYKKQVGIWIANQYTTIKTYEELEKYHEQYWERISIPMLKQLLQ
ncbi:14392_t:CDS:2, partial [Racocetra persica]